VRKAQAPVAGEAGAVDDDIDEGAVDEHAGALGGELEHRRQVRRPADSAHANAAHRGLPRPLQHERRRHAHKRRRRGDLALKRAEQRLQRRGPRDRPPHEGDRARGVDRDVDAAADVDAAESGRARKQAAPLEAMGLAAHMHGGGAGEGEAVDDDLALRCVAHARLHQEAHALLVDEAQREVHLRRQAHRHTPQRRRGRSCGDAVDDGDAAAGSAVDVDDGDAARGDGDAVDDDVCGGGAGEREDLGDATIARTKTRR
jgi:hypothetical protein